MRKINPKKHDVSPNFRRVYPERLEKIYEHVKSIEKDKAARTIYFTSLDLIKTFRKWSIDKGYADKDSEGFLFLEKYQSYNAGIQIKKEYDEYVSERVKDITADLKSIF